MSQGTMPDPPHSIQSVSLRANAALFPFALSFANRSERAKNSLRCKLPPVLSVFCDEEKEDDDDAAGEDNKDDCARVVVFVVSVVSSSSLLANIRSSTSMFSSEFGVACVVVVVFKEIVFLVDVDDDEDNFSRPREKVVLECGIRPVPLQHEHTRQPI